MNAPNNARDCHPKPRILIVEDSTIQAEVLKRALVKAGYAVDVARDGAEGLSRTVELRPALVISDILMPKMDGYELSRHIKTDESLKHIPIILLTSLSDTSDVLRGLECGADEFIVKPYDEQYILSQIEYALTNGGTHPEEEAEGSIEIDLAGEKYSIKSSKEKILNLLLSTYETAVKKNLELVETRDELRVLNERLEEKVKERTAALTAEIAERQRIEDALHAKDEELRSMSRQLWQSAKLATMGELAASIAHELNNPLATVGLRVESLMSQIPEEDPKQHSLKIVEQELDRMGNLVANLLQFSRRSHQQISTINVCEEMENTLELIFYHLRKHRITVERKLSPDVPAIHADRQQLRQLFLNLFTNASDAMPQGGTLTLCVTRKTGVLIEVTDTGEGISPENLHKIVEPFFTTKPEGKGTGLGLPICRRIVQEHGGEFEITSEVGRGTTVRISLPFNRAVSSEQCSL